MTRSPTPPAACRAGHPHMSRPSDTGQLVWADAQSTAQQSLLDLALWLGLSEDCGDGERRSPQSIQSKDGEAQGERDRRWIPAPDISEAMKGTSTMQTPPPQDKPLHNNADLQTTPCPPTDEQPHEEGCTHRTEGTGARVAWAQG